MRPGVFAHVGQRLLYDSQQLHLRQWRKLGLADKGIDEPRFRLRLDAELLHVLFKGRRETGFPCQVVRRLRMFSRTSA